MDEISISLNNKVWGTFTQAMLSVSRMVPFSVNAHSDMLLFPHEAAAERCGMEN